MQLSIRLAFFDLEKIHGASLYADTAGDALGCGMTGNHNLEGAYFCTFAAACAELLVDHVNALCVLCDCAGFADLRALTALDADHGLGFAVLFYDLDAGFAGIKFFVKSFRACSYTSKTCHASFIFSYA